MINFKKLAFAPVFLIFLSLALFSFNTILNSRSAIFSLGADSILQLVYLTVYLILAGLFYIVFTTLADDWVYVLPVVLLAGIPAFILLSVGVALVISIGIIAAALLSFLILKKTLKSYITFKATELLLPRTRNFVWMVIIILSFGYFLMINNDIKQNGFEVPEGIIDSALKFAPAPELQQEDGSLAPPPPITLEQIQQLRKNPQLLEQNGLNISMLDELEKRLSAPLNSGKKATIDAKELIKEAVRSQLQKAIEPYLTFVAPTLALLFFISISSLASIGYLIVTPLLMLLFYILERTNFIRFEKEMREVKKLVV